MRFIADAMLGRLARWLRLMGFDTIYEASLEDRVILKTAIEQGRVILTKDTKLAERKIAKTLLINSDNVFEQVAEVIRTLNLTEPGAPRCANCNGTVEQIEKKDAEGYVPEYVYLNYNHFMRCSACGRLYWEGSQYRDMKQRIRKIIEDANRTRYSS